MLFYDFEVFKYDWLVVIVDAMKQQEHVIINDKAQLEEIYQANQKDIWIGFNNKHYDQYIFKGILCDFNPKEINDYIITDGNPGWKFSSLFRKVPLFNYDVMQNGDRGLKWFEGSMGHDIKESDVPFDIDRPLTEEEIKETVKYCKHDVWETIALFTARKADFEAHIGLMKIADGGLNLLAKTKAQLSAVILNAVKQEHDDEFGIDFPKTMKIEKYHEVVEWYENPENRCYVKNDKKNQLEILVAGVPHTFGWGGVHGARDKYNGTGYFLNMDVASLYPSLMIIYELLSRNLKDPSKFKEIYDTRLKYKKEKNPLQLPLKLVLNSTYGVMKDKFNPLYDPLQANRVCVYGQLLLLDLIEKLEPYCEVIQSNTDGVLVKLNHPDDFHLIDDIAYEWEQRTGLVLEFDEYRQVYQKDVNNYVMVDVNGKIKSKGAYVKKLSDIDYGEFPIVNKALVDYTVQGIPIETTVLNCDKLRDFQLIEKASYKFSHIQHGDNTLKEKCIRIFASIDESDAGVVKIHAETGRTHKVSNSPDHCFIDNSDVTEKIADERLDKRWYVELAKKRLNDFGVMV